MAYRTFSLYNIDATVGKGGSNAAEDVRLIQGLIAIVMSDSRMGPFMQKLAKEKNLGALPPVPTPNGTYSASLEAWIIAMQHMIRVRSPQSPVDGRIDPMKEGDDCFELKFKGASGRQLTLAMLNKTALLFDHRAYIALGSKVQAPYWAELDGQQIYAQV